MRSINSVIIIGGGAAGMMCALHAAWNGAKVTLLERNNRLGLKLAITGKGRCNLTNNSSIQELIEHIPKNGRFLYSAFNYLSSQNTIQLFEKLGVATKVERGNRVFPQSDYAKDVIAALVQAIHAAKITVEYNTRAVSVQHDGQRVSKVLCLDGRVLQADSVVIATGGLSYPRTGSTGDGYTIAKEAGHTLVPTKGSLVPLEVQEEWVRDVQGLALKNVELSSPETKEFGEMLFTHFGISGPIVLTMSSSIVPLLKRGPVPLSIDLKPALTPEQLDARILRDFASVSRKHFSNSLAGLLPSSLIPIVVKLTGIQADKPVNQITKLERESLVNLIKALPLTSIKPRPIEEAIVTAGGVNTKEINPKTLESKLLKGLFFAGEVIDVDGYTGGYNLQIAWSTGALAGRCAALT